MSAVQSPLSARTFPPVDFETEATQLIRKISHLAAQATSPEAFAAAAAREIAAAPTTAEVSLTLRNPVTGEVWQASGQPRGRGTSEFALDLEVRGIRYGRLELRTTASAATALTLAQTLAEQLARYAELHAERTRQQHLIAFGLASEQQLRRQKMVARASGILIAERGMSQIQAQSWIETEARRQRRTLTAIAEKVIEQSSQANWLKATA
ncbi:MAG: ANTAR domain-containing protein [Acidobacteria bacterium]|nr:ANTAR domain-containing protein [Acidobacteriota bacterium]